MFTVKWLWHFLGILVGIGILIAVTAVILHPPRMSLDVWGPVQLHLGTQARGSGTELIEPKVFEDAEYLNNNYLWVADKSLFVGESVEWSVIDPAECTMFLRTDPLFDRVEIVSAGIHRVTHSGIYTLTCWFYGGSSVSTEVFTVH